MQKTGRGGSLTKEDEKWGRCRDAERGERETEKQKNDGLEFSCDRIQQPGQFNAGVSYEIEETR